MPIFEEEDWQTVKIMGIGAGGFGVLTVSLILLSVLVAS